MIPPQAMISICKPAEKKLGEERGGNGRVSLTGAALGGTTLPDADTVQPLGRPGYVVTVAPTVCRVVGLGTHGYPLWTTVEEVSRCVPSKGRGAPLETAVTEGAGSEGGVPSPPLLIWPPEDLMDCQEPELSP